jgi:hypothetical protein
MNGGRCQAVLELSLNRDACTFAISSACSCELLGAFRTASCALFYFKGWCNQQRLTQSCASCSSSYGNSRVVSVYVCCAGTGRTGFIPVAPNNYPFYSSADEVYTPVLQSDGGQLSGAVAVAL